MDREVCSLLGLTSTVTCEYNHWPLRVTSSVDAAIALAERVLPEWTFDHIGQDYIRAIGKAKEVSSIGWTVEMTDGIAISQGQAPTLALAIVIAILKAKESIHDE